MAPGATTRLRVWGDFACFTRPEMKVERVSYDVMTPSAARNILQAICWRPAIEWEVMRIDVLRPIRWTSVRRNEVGSVVPTTSAITAMKRGAGSLGLYIEEDRQQRAALILRNVDYLIHARFHMTARAGADDNAGKFAEMFRRRAERGQCAWQPYLGCREFAAFFALVPDGESLPAVEDTRELGWMLHDLDYDTHSTPTPQFFRAHLNAGRMDIPPRKRVEVGE
ncbi:type I-C CRISPR-associated protein Cas5c [Piscinibacter sp.]|uniref:type I-C CRISPR-associated protein Cas5c n=1 Tax=Piscinibacter sp. TaxID=1903157 RepID=UPI002CACD581|nr:type I-C CRISPR-associated protein Cas5c [Albitalea sp.]HUG26113.1 type I-C CRISPR-associated protein Cas5c [Albitalea sp.]